MTFSLAARCLETGMFGVVVCSSSPAVAARCAFVRAGVGAVLSQNVTDPSLGPRLLEGMARGLSAQAAIADVTADAPWIDYRQLLAIGRTGPPASHSGARTLGTHAVAAGHNAMAAGNMLAASTVPAAMIAVFDAATGTLGDRILAALAGGVAAGGEEGPLHSAGMLLADSASWPVADLRIDWSEGDPVADLRALWARYAPQMGDYVARALNPSLAPSYGVPGDR